MFRKATLSFLLSLFTARGLWASDELSLSSLFEADFVDLMQISVITPSRKEEKWFEAPISTSVLTAKQIRQSGVTSIPEALRLIPGMIVREMVNGQFDVHIRGLDSVPPNKSYPDSFNKSTLVMIDHRPVYNHFNGAMLWQELPVDIHDIERIEVVRGPVGTVYGANAATGVIHLITHRAESGENHISWSQGEYGSKDIRARFSGEIDERISFAGSIHQNQRQRMDDQYFSFNDLQYTSKNILVNSVTGVPLDQVDTRYPDTLQALDKTAVNLFVDINHQDDGVSRISAGTVSSDFQNAFYDTRSTPLGVYSLQQSYFGYSFDNKDMHISLNGRHADFLAITTFNFDFAYQTLQAIWDYRLLNQENLDLSLGAALEESRYKAPFLGGTADSLMVAYLANLVTDQWNPFSFLSMHEVITSVYRIKSSGHFQRALTIERLRN